MPEVAVAGFAESNSDSMFGHQSGNWGFTIGANFTIFDGDARIVEIPPAPPVLSTLVAEVYGPDQESRLRAAKDIRAVFENSPGVVDVD